MSIFERESKKDFDFEKDILGLQMVRPYKHEGRWVFDDQEGLRRDIAPAGATVATLSPIVVGADRLIMEGTRRKGIENPESGFRLYFSDKAFPDADVEFRWERECYDGHIYNVLPCGDKIAIPSDQQAWICPYLMLYYKQPPKILFLKIEADGR